MRILLMLLGAARPLTARAQLSALPVIGFLHGSSPPAFPEQTTAFRLGLNDAGYVEDQSWLARAPAR